MVFTAIEVRIAAVVSADLMRGRAERGYRERNRAANHILLVKVIGAVRKSHRAAGVCASRDDRRHVDGEGYVLPIDRGGGGRGQRGFGAARPGDGNVLAELRGVIRWVGGGRTDKVH